MPNASRQERVGVAPKKTTAKNCEPLAKYSFSQKYLTVECTYSEFTKLGSRRGKGRF
jgi:hypothetical protein